MPLAARISVKRAGREIRDAGASGGANGEEKSAGVCGFDGAFEKEMMERGEGMKACGVCVAGGLVREKKEIADTCMN